MRIVFTVTNDLSYDQRMQRICHTLSTHGYSILLVGRSLPHSIPLTASSFRQKRLYCPFRKGVFFYAAYNLQLFFYLLFLRRYDAICSIDLDTLPAGFLASLLRRKKRVFDAHEYFTEVPEVVNRPLVKSFWSLLARLILPYYRHAYTVGKGLAQLMEEKYGLQFSVIRNVAAYTGNLTIPELQNGPRIILYQGALNEGRGLETAIAAMQYLENVQLVIAGEGDLSLELRALTKRLQLENKVQFLGFVTPVQLKKYTSKAWVGINLLENRGLSYYYSLANKFFDFVQAGVPILTMDFPEYRALNEEYEVAILLPDLKEEGVVKALQLLLNKKELHAKLQDACLVAREVWNWEAEEKTLLQFWTAVFSRR